MLINKRRFNKKLMLVTELPGNRNVMGSNPSGTAEELWRKVLGKCKERVFMSDTGKLSRTITLIIMDSSGCTFNVSLLHL